MNKSIEELLTTLHNDPELEHVNPLLQEESIIGRGIKWQMENATTYTYKVLTKKRI